MSLWQRGAENPDRVAIVDPFETRWTYGELLDDANRWSNLLRSRGVARGDRVALASPNSFDFLAVVAATMQIGVRLVPVNFHLTGPEIAHILTDGQAKVFIVDERIGEAGRDAADTAGLRSDARIAIGKIEGFASHREALAGQPNTSPPDRCPGQRMYYTSGTTGKPKGVVKPMPTGDADEAAVAQTQKVYGNTGRDDSEDAVTLVPGPLYHGAPMGAGLGGLHCGQTVVLMERWDTERALQLIERYRVTSTTMVPTMFQRLLQLDPTIRDAYDVSSLQSVAHAGAPCSIDVKRAMIEWWGPVLNEYYSATEGGGTRVSSEEWLERPGTVGRPGPGSAIRILDDDGNGVPPRTIGRVFMLLKEPFEYFNDPEKTRSTVVDGFLTVGDIGYVDEEGYLFLCDRATNLIISGGVNIYPAEAEAALIAHPAVLEVAVFGIPNAEWGEEVKAVVQVRPGVQPSDELTQKLLEHCASQIAKYKCPRSIDYVDELPRDDNGKLYKQRLRDAYWGDQVRKI
jgi:long-chain acyl-CoA synthetase